MTLVVGAPSPRADRDPVARCRRAVRTGAGAPRRRVEPVPTGRRPRRSLARGPQPGDGRAHPQRRGHRRARGRAEGRAGPARATGVGGAVVRGAGRASARVSRPARGRGRGVRADHDRARWASRSVSRATRCGPCSNGSTGTSTHVGDVIAPRTVTAAGGRWRRGAGDARAGRPRRAHECVELPLLRWAATRSCPRCSTGNAVLYKPSEHATLTGLRLVDLMHRGGVSGRRDPGDRRGRAASAPASSASDIDMVLLHRVRTRRAVGRAAVGRPTAARTARARRQGRRVRCDDVDVDDRRARGRRRCVLQRRPVVLGDRTDLRARRGLRPVRRRVRRGRRCVPRR